MGGGGGANMCQTCQGLIGSHGKFRAKLRRQLGRFTGEWGEDKGREGEKVGAAGVGRGRGIG